MCVPYCMYELFCTLPYSEMFQRYKQPTYLGIVFTYKKTCKITLIEPQNYTYYLHLESLCFSHLLFVIFLVLYVCITVIGVYFLYYALLFGRYLDTVRNRCTVGCSVVMQRFFFFSMSLWGFADLGIEQVRYLCNLSFSGKIQLAQFYTVPARTYSYVDMGLRNRSDICGEVFFLSR